MTAGSLGARLSLWLALQSLAGLGLVCGALYLALDWTLAQRRHETLAQKETAVRELLAEGRADHQPEDLPHLLEDMLAGHGDLALRLADGTGRTVFARPLPAGVDAPAHRFAVTVEGWAAPVEATLQLDPRADAALLRRMAGLLLAAALGGTAVVSLGGWLLVRLGLAPLRQLAAQTGRLDADTLARRLDGRAQPAELQPLIAQFNALLDRLAAAYAQMEAFNADVAHELNTPLATLISGSELALRQAGSTAELQDLLGSHLEELDRLARIVADMLFLSRAHRGAQARCAEVASLAALAAEVAEFHEAALQQAALVVRIAGDAAAAVDAGLLQRALSNLLGNATRHATPGSTVWLRIAAQPGRTEIVVDNAGPAIAPEHLPRLFDRFFRADPARSQADQHHGLGLAIVAAIARMHGGGTLATSDAGRTRIGLWLRGAQMTQTSSNGAPS
ncbi:heavy metal sensor histidine kinase [Pseudorhodoferax sp.]|uniref:heavy metal sensor histidine kinase n=1 Tax=Pseudorhodoferax sp. TaxID=1993553 RepID=UPI002DD61CD4|nr:heavy metal sensor histidine kinase [Pseudorhodoferax sp.]